MISDLCMLSHWNNRLSIILVTNPTIYTVYALWWQWWENSKQTLPTTTYCASLCHFPGEGDATSCSLSARCVMALSALTADAGWSGYCSNLIQHINSSMCCDTLSAQASMFTWTTARDQQKQESIKWWKGCGQRATGTFLLSGRISVMPRSIHGETWSLYSPSMLVSGLFAATVEHRHVHVTHLESQAQSIVPVIGA